jgi:hypothetical protein
VEGRHFASPYISLTVSPYRALRFGRATVFIIDAVRLRATKVHTERTTVLASQCEIPYKGPGRTQYITESYWLAHSWVPADCIVKRIPFDGFKGVREENKIFERMFLVSAGLDLAADLVDDRNESGNDRRLDINAFEKKKYTLNRVHVGFGDEEDLAVHTQKLSVNGAESLQIGMRLGAEGSLKR